MWISQRPQQRSNSATRIATKLNYTRRSTAQRLESGGAGHRDWLLGSPNHDSARLWQAANHLPYYWQVRSPTPPLATISASTYLWENSRPQTPTMMYNSIPEMLFACQDPWPLQVASYEILNPAFTLDQSWAKRQHLVARRPSVAGGQNPDNPQLKPLSQLATIPTFCSDQSWRDDEQMTFSTDCGIMKSHQVLRHPVPQPRWCRPRGAFSI